MIYFSEIKNKRIYTEDNVFVGHLTDLVFRFTETPTLTKILVKPVSNISKEPFYISFENLLKINSKIFVAKNYKTVELSENELFIDKNLLDKQIIDIKGSKVVRVNDVVIQSKSDNDYFILGVDTSLEGVLRWFGLDRFTPKEPEFLPWSNIQPLELTQGKVVLNVQQEKLSSFHPADLADYLETTNVKNVTQIIDLLDKEFAAKVISELNINYQASLLRKLTVEKTAKLIELMDPDDAVDALAEFTTKRVEAILEKVDDKTRKELERLLSYDDTAIGQSLTPEYMTVFGTDTVSKVIDRIKNEGIEMDFFKYVYVINETEQLTGVFDIHELIIQKSDTPVYKFMRQNLVVAHLNSSVHGTFRKMIKYKVSALPVTDINKKIVGIITLNDLSEEILKTLGR